MESKESVNIVIYARFSSHTQNEQSIEGQLKTCYDYAERNGYTVIKEYTDRAISGKTDNRPQFLQMIEDSNKKQFQYVLVYQLDRFSRDKYDNVVYKRKLKKNGIRVLSARENISADASGVLLETMLEGLAEYFSHELAQKIQRGMDINASKCLSTGGNVALGYYVGEDKRFYIDEDTAPIVRRIFEMYVNGHKMADIQHYLNAHQIKTSRGNEYNKNSIGRILKNKRYRGIYTYNGIETIDGIPRIVSDELFNEVQTIMEKNQKAPARSKAKEEYILTTKLFCGHCESAMTGITGTSKNKTKYHYYQCVNNRKKQGCKKKNVKKAFIEDLVVTETVKLLTDERIQKIAQQVIELYEKETDASSIKRLEKLLKENKKATDNLIKALELGQVAEVITAQISLKLEERKELEKQLAIESMEQPTLSVMEVKFFLSRFKNGDINDIKYRKSLIDTFINKIHLYDDKMTIFYNVKDGQSTVNIKSTGSKCSPNAQMVEMRGVEVGATIGNTYLIFYDLKL